MVLLLLILAVRARLALWHSLMHAASLISGDICTRTLLVSPGPGGMAHLPLTSTFVAPYVWVSSVFSCAVVPCPFSNHCALSLSMSVPDVVPSVPELTPLSCPRMLTTISSPLLGAVGVPPSLVSCLSPNGGRRVRAQSGVSPLNTAGRDCACSSSRDLLVHFVEQIKAKVDRGSSPCVGPYHSAWNWPN